MFLHNTFQTLAAVKLQPGGHGTQVHVTLRSGYGVAAFMTLWLGIVLLFTIVILSGALAGSAHFEDLAFIVPFPLFGFGFVAGGRLIARSERATLLGFIRQTTGAQDEAPEPGSAG
jgi:hypothetical protein